MSRDYAARAADDSVYLESDKNRHAYVLKDNGKIYIGDFKRINVKPWIFGQVRQMSGNTTKFPLSPKFQCVSF